MCIHVFLSPFVFTVGTSSNFQEFSKIKSFIGTEILVHPLQFRRPVRAGNVLCVGLVLSRMIPCELPQSRQAKKQQLRLRVESCTALPMFTFSDKIIFCCGISSYLLLFRRNGWCEVAYEVDNGHMKDNLANIYWLSYKYSRSMCLWWLKRNLFSLEENPQDNKSVLFINLRLSFKHVLTWHFPC